MKDNIIENLARNLVDTVNKNNFTVICNSNLTLASRYLVYHVKYCQMVFLIVDILKLTITRKFKKSLFIVDLQKH